MLGLLAKKIGMTHLFDDQGNRVPVTVLLAGGCVVQKKSLEKDGYDAVQIGFDEIPMKKANKCLKGHFAKSKTSAFRFLREFRGTDVKEIQEGQQVKVDLFKKGEMVDVKGVSKGKGFQGVVKRWHFRGGANSHGSMFHRAPGSIGSSSDPSRVFKGLKMPGHLGAKVISVQNLKIIKIDPEKNLLALQGAVPGAKQGYLIVNRAVKTKVKATVKENITKKEKG